MVYGLVPVCLHFWGLGLHHTLWCVTIPEHHFSVSWSPDYHFTKQWQALTEIRLISKNLNPTDHFTEAFRGITLCNMSTLNYFQKQADLNSSGSSQWTRCHTLSPIQLTKTDQQTTYQQVRLDLNLLEFGSVDICDVEVPGWEHLITEVDVSLLAKLDIALIVRFS